MRLALLQPQFAPNLYDFASMMKAERVIFRDTDKWSRKGRTHRAKIRTLDGTQWINIPIKTNDKGKAINAVRIEQNEPWFDTFWSAVLHNYSTAVYFDFYQDEIYAELEQASKFEKLIDFNLYFFKRLMRFLERDISFELASDLPEYSPDPDECARNLGGTLLYQEFESKNYQRQSALARSGLQEHPNYRQAFEGFEPECSVLDVLLNYGRESYKIIERLF